MTLEERTEQYCRTRILIGNNALLKLYHSRIAIFGAGGVGGGVIEALARSGIGTLDLIDNDRVSLSNCNRQLLATHDTLGQYKVDAARERIRSIDPDITVNTYRLFYLPETARQLDFSKWDYIVDAIDTVAAKIDIIVRAQTEGIPIISCMGCGNRLDPTKLFITDLYKTSMDPLARVMRRELSRRNIRHLKVLFSTEPARKPLEELPTSGSRRSTPGSVSFVPPVAGMIIASEVVKDLLASLTDE